MEVNDADAQGKSTVHLSLCFQLFSPSILDRLVANRARCLWSSLDKISCEYAHTEPAEEFMRRGKANRISGAKRDSGAWLSKADNAGPLSLD